MALNPSSNSTMTGRVTAPTTEYPYGSAQNETSAGAGNGTPYFKERSDDLFGFQQALLGAASITPSGDADSAVTSQYLDALKIIGTAGVHTWARAGDTSQIPANKLENAVGGGANSLVYVGAVNKPTETGYTLVLSHLGFTPFLAMHPTSDIDNSESSVVGCNSDTTSRTHVIVPTPVIGVFRIYGIRI